MPSVKAWLISLNLSQDNSLTRISQESLGPQAMTIRV